MLNLTRRDLIVLFFSVYVSTGRHCIRIKINQVRQKHGTTRITNN